MQIELKIIPATLLNNYVNLFNNAVADDFYALQESEISTATFNFYHSVAAVFSSRIEGEIITLDEFIKHRIQHVEFQPDYTRKIDDLYHAYQFATENPLTAENFKMAHGLLTKNILQPNHQGTFRTGNMYVLTESGKIEYVAAAPHVVNEHVNFLFDDITKLLEADLAFAEVLYFASMLHLVFVKIHPFNDGNGRASRLLEKWFLAEKLGSKAWFIESERFYHDNYDMYFANIRKLGLEYEQLNYLQADTFILMLQKSIATK